MARNRKVTLREDWQPEESFDDTIRSIELLKQEFAEYENARFMVCTGWETSSIDVVAEIPETPEEKAQRLAKEKEKKAKKEAKEQKLYEELRKKYASD